MTDSKFFSTQKKGEIIEWKNELNSDKPEKRKEAVKKVIAAMTVGKDVSMLFPDVTKCVVTTSVELKKLVYLYIMNYAKSQPDLAILAVNTFVTDARHENPLVRALAVRTMACIRVEKITEYLAEPLRTSLRDSDPYVRKTAAVAVPKLYDIDPQLVLDQGFIDALKDLLMDPNPMVVANAVASLSELSQKCKEAAIEYNNRTVNTLLAALNECTEWGQIFILDALAKYNPRSSEEAENMADRVAPRLSHANSAVVLSAIKVILRLMDMIRNEDIIKGLSNKIAPTLVTLLSAEHEIQYTALRNIDLIVQKRPLILQHEIKVFFCKYNDPIYVKMEKLDIMIKLASEKNIDTVLMELKEYATEIDVEFVRKSVRAIGGCAIKLERAAQRCIDVLLDLIQTKVSYVVQEAIVVIKDIFRKYPNRYESIIGILCENLEILEEPDAKASMIWIIGEYADKIENADELLAAFCENFHDEPSMVQLQILTATVKLFLRRPSDTEGLVTRVLQLCTEESDNPDLRDRGYVYWRLLSTDPEATKAVVFAEKPGITDDSINLQPTLLDELISNIGTLSSIYHKPPEMFVLSYNTALKATPLSPVDYDDRDDRDDTHGALGGGDGASSPVDNQQSLGSVDLLNLSDMSLEPIATNSSSSSKQMTQNMSSDPFSFDELINGPLSKPVVEKALLLSADKGRGLQVHGAFQRRDKALFVDFTFENTSNQPMLNFAIKLNVNTFGLSAGPQLPVPTPLLPNQRAEFSLPVQPTGNVGGSATNIIQMAVKNNAGVVYFQIKVPFHMLISENGKMERQEFLGIWQSISDEEERTSDLSRLSTTNPDAIKKKLEAYNIFFIAKRTVEAKEIFYFCARTVQDINIVFELIINPQTQTAKCCTRTSNPEQVPLFHETLQTILSQ